MAILIFLLGMVLAPPAAFAQDVARLDLGLTVSARGADAELNLTLRLIEDVEVGRVEAEIRFPHERMKFFGARDRAPEGVRVDVQEQPRDPERDPNGETLLKVVAEGVDRPIPTGVLSTLVFHVAAEGPDEAISVRLAGRLWAYPEVSQEIAGLLTYDGRVTLQDARTFFACFFYMH